MTSRFRRMTTMITREIGKDTNEQLAKKAVEVHDELMPAVLQGPQEMSRTRAMHVLSPENIREVRGILSTLKSADVATKILTEDYRKNRATEHIFVVETLARHPDGSIDRRTVVANAADAKFLDEYHAQDIKKRSLIIAVQSRPAHSVAGRFNQIWTVKEAVDFVKANNMPLPDVFNLTRHGWPFDQPIEKQLDAVR
jgi:hypothetical protein